MSIAVASLLTGIRADLDEPVEAKWTDVSILSWINAAVMRVSTALRSVREDQLVQRITSADASLTINGSTYDPSSLAIVSGTSIYTLPPDLIEIRSIEPTSSDDLDDGVRFEARDLSHPDFMEMDRITSTSETDTLYFYDIYGVNSMKIVPEPSRAIPTTLFYVRYTQHYGSGDAIDILPDYCESALRAYAVYRAFRAITHPDTSISLQIYQEEVAQVRSIARPRQSQTINVVADFFDGDDPVIAPRIDPYV